MNDVSVYCNGDEMTPAKKITLTHRLMQSWETILAEVNRYINPQNTATRLYVHSALVLSRAQPLRGGGGSGPPKIWTDYPNFFDEECDYRYVTDSSARNWV